MPAHSHFGAHTILAFTEATLSRMPVLKVIKKIKTPSFARLSPLATCRIIGLREAGAERDDIRKQVKKKDGTSPSLRAVDDVLERFKEDPEWDGLEERTAGGRPRHLTSEQEAKIQKILLRDVGKHVVSATYVKRLLKEIRHIPDKTIQRTFIAWVMLTSIAGARQPSVTNTSQLG